MKVLLYEGNRRLVSRSGVGTAMSHQEQALESNQVDYTCNSEEDYDIIHLNTIFPDSWYMARQAKKRGRKVVYHAHSTQEDFRNSFIGSNLTAPLFGQWLYHCYENADVLLTPTPYSQKLLENYGLQMPIIPISNGVDTHFFKKQPELRERFREKYGLYQTDKVVLSVGLPIERKGILDFITLAQRIPDYQFFWFGSIDSRLLPARVRRQMQLRLPNLHFPGFATQVELVEAYNGSDLFLFLSQEETEGIVVLEALACQTPVLLRDIPVYEGWLEDGIQVYKRTTLEKLEEAVSGICRGELPDLTEAGCQTARDRDIRQIGSRLKTIYSTLSEERL